MREFWNDINTQKSWAILKQLNKQIRFILIGGWGVYLWSHAMKSKDIDIVLTSWDDLELVKKKYEPYKNDRLKKYEIVIFDVDVDIYLPHYSKLVIPCEDLISLHSIREGFHVVNPEPLLLLKQQAYIERKDSIKGQKDRIDILSLLHSGFLDFKEYRRLVDVYHIPSYVEDLRDIIKNTVDEFSYLSIKNPREIKKLKERWMNEIDAER